MADGYISQIKTPDNKVYLLKDSDKINSISASGTAPLTLSGSKSGTTYTLTGSVADASASASGIINTGTQTFGGKKTLKFTSRIYPLTGATGERSRWYKITFPYHDATTDSAAKWFMNSFDLHIGGGYSSNASGVAHVTFYWVRAGNNGAWAVGQQAALIEGTLVNKIGLYYRIAEPGILYVNNTTNAYNGIWIDNLYVDDTSPSLDWSTITITNVADITESTSPKLSDYTKITTSYLYNDGGTLKTDSNFEGKYIKGTWLYTSAATAKTSTTKLATIESDNFIYYITPANALKSAIGTTAIGAEKTPIYWNGSGFSTGTALKNLAYKDSLTANDIPDISGTYIKKVSSTDEAIVRFNGTDGSVQNSNITINDNGSISFPTEQDVNFRMNRKNASGGGWAHRYINWYDNSNNIFANIGIYGTNDAFDHMYIGSNEGYSSDLNLQIYANGTIKGKLFSGSGASLTSLNGSNISSGTVAEARIDSTIARLASPAFTGTPTAPTAANGTSTTQIATTAFVNNTLAYVNAMSFKGTLGTGGTVTALPASHDAGDTYRVITAGTWAGKYCEVGTLIICVKDGTTAADADWTSVETNEDGAVIGPSSSTENQIAKFNSATGRTITNSGITIDSSDNMTIPGSIYFSSNTSTTTGKPLFAYNSTYTKFGIWYKEGTPDVMAFSASGNGDTTTSADFAIEGGGKLYNKGNIIPYTDSDGSVGDTTTPVYVDGGQIKVCTSYANATVGTANKATAANLTTTQNAIAYYSNATGTFANGQYVTYLCHAAANAGTNKAGNIDGILITGNAYGEAANLISNTEGQLSYGDAGPQIRFNSGSQLGAMIFDHYDSTSGMGASFHFVSNQGNTAVKADGLIARTRAMIGGNSVNNNYVLYSNGATYINSTLTMNGVITAKGNQYTDGYTGALNMNNSNIYGLNSIYTCDTSDNASEGIHFYRSATTVDSLWINGGNIYFAPNRTITTDTTTGVSTSAANSEKVLRLPATINGSRAVYTNGSNGMLAESSVTATELGYLSGVTSAIQTQLNEKSSTSHNHTNTYLRLDGSDTMTGSLKLANNVWNAIGDDIQIGDINEAGTLGIQGKNGATAIRFTTYNQTTKKTGGRITWDGTKFSITSTTAIDASISGNAATATTATNINITTAAPTSSKTVGYLAISPAVTGSNALTAENSVYVYNVVANSAITATYLNVGQGGTSYGGITLHSPEQKNFHGDIKTTTLTANQTYTLPNATGTIALTSDVGVTKVSTGAGLTGGDITSTGTVKANLTNETKLTNAAADGTETSGRVYPVRLDKNGKLAVNVPWTNVNSSYLTSHNNLVKQTAKTSGNFKLLASAQASPSSGTAYEAVYDAKIYMNTTNNQLIAGGFIIHDKAATPVEKVTMQWNATDSALEFIFA